MKLPFIIATLLMSWLGMQAVHELGHVLGAIVSGGEVRRVVLHPLTISRTDLATNPQPLFVVWAGPIVGTILPLLGWMLAAKLRCTSAFLWRFFAGFCLIANGAYIGFGASEQIGDCGEMLQHGSSIWQLWLFGIVTIPLGLLLWHDQAAHFGFGPKKRVVSSSSVWVTAAIVAALLILGISMGE